MTEWKKRGHWMSVSVMQLISIALFYGGVLKDYEPAGRIFCYYWFFLQCLAVLSALLMVVIVVLITKVHSDHPGIGKVIMNYAVGYESIRCPSIWFASVTLMQLIGLIWFGGFFWATVWLASYLVFWIINRMLSFMVVSQDDSNYRLENKRREPVICDEDAWNNIGKHCFRISNRER